MKSSFLAQPVHFPDTACTCAAGPVYDFQLREFSNGSLHVYRICRTCGARAQSPCPRSHVSSLEKWRQLLMDAGVEVRP